MFTKTMQLGVSQNLLTKVPRYFGSSKAILRELFQNSFRAGARNITITYDEKILRFKDDGRGSDAESFLIAGQSGWGEETTAVDPAGLGAFSFLRPEYVTSVSYRSRDWRMTLFPSDLESGQVNVEYGLEETPGMSIELVLTDQVKFGIEDFKAARALYPVAVVFRENDKEPVELKPIQLEDRGAVSVPHAGWVRFGGMGNMDRSIIGSIRYRTFETHVVWQHAFFNSKALEDALTDSAAALKNTNEKELVGAIFRSHEAVFFIDPQSGIRPKLPDREELISDKYLRAAAGRILRSVLDEYVSGFDMDAIKDLPDVMEMERSSTRKEQFSPYQRLRSCTKKDSLAAKLMRDGDIARETFELFGYRRVSWHDPSQICILTHDDGDGSYPEAENGFFGDSDLYVRLEQVITVPDEGMRTSLCEQGFYAIDSTSHDGGKRDQAHLLVQVSSLRYQTGDWLAFVDELLVNGRPVQFLARSNPNTAWNCAELDLIDEGKEARLKDNVNAQYEEEGEDLVLVIATSPAQFLSELAKEYTAWRGYITWLHDDQGILDRLTSYHNGEYEFDDIMIETSIKQAAIRWLEARLVDVLGAQEAIQGTLEKLHHAMWNIDLCISPKGRELRAKAAVWLVWLALCFASYVLQLRSEEINRQFKRTVEKGL